MKESENRGVKMNQADEGQKKKKKKNQGLESFVPVASE